MRNILRLAVIATFTAFLLASCKQPTSETPATETIAWQTDGNGFLQYKTNDTDKYGYGEFISISTSNSVVPTKYPGGTVTANIKRMTGAAGYGYGIMFCFQDSKNYYLFLVSENGGYTVYKMVAGTYTKILGWASATTAFYQGYGIENTISVYQEAANTYDLSVNGKYINSFTDADLANSGYAGFYVSIANSTYENFPTISEDVRFKLTAPVTAPSN